jgi:hypothetical protein
MVRRIRKVLALQDETITFGPKTHPPQLTTSASVHPFPRPCTQAQASRFINPSSIDR